MTTALVVSTLPLMSTELIPTFAKVPPGLPDFYVAATHYSSSTQPQDQEPQQLDQKSTGIDALSFQ
jgi:hypothetical protein